MPPSYWQNCMVVMACAMFFSFIFFFLKWSRSPWEQMQSRMFVIKCVCLIIVIEYKTHEFRVQRTNFSIGWLRWILFIHFFIFIHNMDYLFFPSFIEAYLKNKIVFKLYNLIWYVYIVKYWLKLKTESLWRNTGIQVLYTKIIRSPSRVNQKRAVSRHIIIKLSKIKV